MTIRNVAARSVVRGCLGLVAAVAAAAPAIAADPVVIVPGIALSSDPTGPTPGYPYPGYPYPGEMPPAPTSVESTCGQGCEGGPGCATGRCGGSSSGLFSRWFPCACTEATVPPPLGDAVRSVTVLQTNNALAEYFVIFQEDWVHESDRLNATGQRHLDGIVRRLGQAQSSIKVEPIGIPAVDETRRAALIAHLVGTGVSVDAAQSLVVLGGTRAEGLRYRAIERVYGSSDSSGLSNNNYNNYQTFPNSNSFGGFGFFR